MNVRTLREQYPTCEYVSYTHQLIGEDCQVEFVFRLSELIFRPNVIFKNIPVDSLYRKTPDAFSSFFFSLGCIEIFSYWKLTTSPRIDIQPHTLTSEQLQFWYTLLEKGMAEYRWRNSLSLEDCQVEIVSKGTVLGMDADILPFKRALVPVGGGKDSALTLGLLAQHGKTYSTLLLNPIPAAERCAEFTGQPIIRVERSLDPLLLQKNREGYLNGHTPFSAYLAFVGITAGALYGYSDIVLSNERSAEEETVMDGETPVFHQYSKTYAFEKDFCEYVQTYITHNIHYWSLLRPLYEIQIAQKLSAFPQFLPMIKSCNKQGREDIWCGVCPKCVSTYILLFPFVDKETIFAVFGKDIYQDLSLYDRIVELIDPSVTRPFECVGTREETIVSLLLAYTWYRSSHTRVPELLENVYTRYLQSRHQEIVEMTNTILETAWGEDQQIPYEYAACLR
jgi:UDP-N-acetyl-alpha-D-muramoyl-L-alanyl-L-glutamate epimerase